MKNNKMYYVIGGIAVLGIGYYLWNKSKKSAEVKEATDETTKSDLGTDATATAPAPTPATAPAPATAPTSETSPKKLTAQELESKLQSSCGKKPKLKKNIVKYNQCRDNATAKLKKEGLVAFDGSYGFEGVAEKYEDNVIRENSFAKQVTNREDGRMFAGYVYNN
jgi:hypothetical protein